MSEKELRFAIASEGQRAWVYIYDDRTPLGRIARDQMEPHFAKLISPMVELTTDASYTTAEVAALVEEIKAKTYDGVKARMLTLIETLLQAKGLGTGSIGRLVDILLRDVDRQLVEIATKYVPDITPTLLDEKRRERDAAEDRHDGRNTEEHIRFLREQADRLEGNTEERREQGLRHQVLTTLNGAGVATLESVEEYLRRKGIRPLKTETIYPRR